MTKEELEKEAEEKYCKGCKWRIEQCLWAWRKTNGLKEPNEKNCSCKEVPAYLAGAETREKQIQIDAEQIRALQKQNGELTDKVNDLEDKLANADYQLEGRDLEIQELEAQIEKMKCGDNCKYGCMACGSYLCDLGLDGCNEIPFNCDKWELKEDVL